MSELERAASALSEPELSAILYKENGHLNRDEERYNEFREMVPDYIRQMTIRHTTYEVPYTNYSGKVANPYGYTYHNISRPVEEMHKASMVHQ